MNHALAPSLRKQPFEIKLGYLMPAFVLLGLVVNLQITKPRDLVSDNLVQVPVRASHSANYGVDPLDLNFAPLNPAVIDEVRKDNKPNNSGGDAVLVLPSPSAGPSATATPAPTATPGGLLPEIVPTLLPGLPTLPPLLPTDLPGVVPTLINSLPIVPTLLPVVPTVVNSVPVVPTVVQAIPTVANIVATLVPVPLPTVCIPLLTCR
jgi:hypothetical protein